LSVVSLRPFLKGNPGTTSRNSRPPIVQTFIKP
jgi:hypothetical protein